MFEYGFLKKLMFELSKSSNNRVDKNSATSSDVTTEIELVAQRAVEREEEQWLLAGSRCPLLGHLVQIAQVCIRWGTSQYCLLRKKF